ncbi:MAG: PDZ domain-containing protein [Pirellulales bacterium]
MKTCHLQAFTIMRLTMVGLLLGAGLPWFNPARADSLAHLEQQAFRAAVAEVAESVVQIHAVGGLEQVDQVLLTGGPSTGLIVSADGHIVTSAYTIAQQPTSILVRLPDGRQAAARVVARDYGRMLVLLKVKAERPLPTVQLAPLDTMRVGQSALAIGRTYRADQVDVSVGIVSALRRMHGRVLQTDANISAVNYGGPLVDLHGRVLGVMVPMSPNPQGNAAHHKGGQNEVAGVEFYDSGIGFAVPLAHIMAKLESWKQGVDLEPGLLGVGLISGASFATPATIATIWHNSPAASAGWKPDDRIVAIDGIPVETQDQLRSQIVPRYAGDQLRVTLQRGDQQLESQVTLTATLEVFRHAMIGFLPMRDSIEPKGVIVRDILPESPAAQAGLQPADRLTKIGDEKVASVDRAMTVLAKHHPGQEVAVTILRSPNEEQSEQDRQIGTKAPAEQTLSIRLANLTADLPDRTNRSPEPAKTPKVGEVSAPAGKSPNHAADSGTHAADSKKVDQTSEAYQLKSFRLPEFSHQAQVLRPKKLDPSRKYPLLIWLHDRPELDRSELDRSELAKLEADAWRPYCQRDGLLLLQPQFKDSQDWSADDLKYLRQLIRAASRRLYGDPLRIGVAGRGKGGQLAYLLGLRHLVPAVITIDTPVPRTVTLGENQPGQRLMLLSLQRQNSPLQPLLRKDFQRLHTAGYPTAQWELRNPNGQLEPRDRDAISRWIGALDRL